MTENPTDLPPQNIGAEEATLGSMMVSERARTVAQRILRRDDFYRPSHRLIWDSILKVSTRGREVDEKVIIDDLRATPAPKGEGSAKLIDQVGGALGVLRLAERVPAAANIKAYAEEVRRVSILRQVEAAGRETMAAAHEKETPVEAVAVAERGVLALRERLDQSDSGGIRSESEAVDDFCDAYAMGEDRDLVPFALPTLNQTYGGQRKGQVIFTGGWSSDGKSWYVLGDLEAAALHGARSLLVTAEVPTEEIVARQIAMGGHDFGRLMRRTLPANEIVDRVKELRHLPIDIEERSRPTMGYLRTLLMRARVAGKPYRYVVVDHFHLMDHQSGKQGGDFRIAIGESAAAAKELAKDFGVTINFAAQLRRASTTGSRKFPLPGMQDIRESSAIENIADLVLMVWRERTDPPQETQTNSGLVAVAKVRSGRAIAPIPVTFLSRNFRFVEQVSSHIPGAAA